MTAVHILLLAAFASVSASPASAGTEISVSLFGQPCMLAGPLDKMTLRLIHSASPDQIYPQEVNSEGVKKSLDRLKAMPTLPSSLDRYRDRLTKRLEAQAAFFAALETPAKPGQPSPLEALNSQTLQNKRSKEFKDLARKLDTKDLTPQHRKELVEQLLDIYNEAIEGDPEEDFHRGIKALNVQYTCSFEGPAEGSTAEGAPTRGE